MNSAKQIAPWVPKEIVDCYKEDLTDRETDWTREGFYYAAASLDLKAWKERWRAWYFTQIDKLVTDEGMKAVWDSVPELNWHEFKNLNSDFRKSVTFSTFWIILRQAYIGARSKTAYMATNNELPAWKAEVRDRAVELADLLEGTYLDQLLIENDRLKFTHDLHTHLAMLNNANSAESACCITSLEEYREQLNRRKHRSNLRVTSFLIQLANTQEEDLQASKHQPIFKYGKPGDPRFQRTIFHKNFAASMHKHTGDKQVPLLKIVSPILFQTGAERNTYDLSKKIEADASDALKELEELKKKQP